MSAVTAISRGKISLARVGARTLLQVTGYDGETFQNVELLLPPGYVANPNAAGDIMILEANGVRGHVVAIAGDNTADTVHDLQPGELGLATKGKQVLLRDDHVIIADPQKIILQAPELYWSPDGTTMYRLATDHHTHNQPPDSDGDAEQPTDAPNTSGGMVTG